MAKKEVTFLKETKTKTAAKAKRGRPAGSKNTATTATKRKKYTRRAKTARTTATDGMVTISVPAHMAFQLGVAIGSAAQA